MPYVNVPNDLSKIKTKIAFNLTKRQLICFGIGAAIGIPTYLLTRGAIGNTGALFVMLGIMLPAFLMAMYEKDGLPFEKVLRNMINTKFLRPGIRPYRTQNMDLQMNANDDESPLSMKADFLLSLCELIVGGREGLQPIEKTVIDRCVRLVYREMALGLETAKTPLLQDLYEELLKQPEPEARRVATALELYCTGSLNLFNHPTNVNLNSRVVCIVLKGLGENLRKIAMHTTNEFVTAAVNANHKAGIATWCYLSPLLPLCPQSWLLD